MTVFDSLVSDTSIIVFEDELPLDGSVFHKRAEKRVSRLSKTSESVEFPTRTTLFSLYFFISVEI